MSINSPIGLVARPALTQALSQTLKIPASAIAFSDSVLLLTNIQAIHHLPSSMTWLVPSMPGEVFRAFSPPILTTDKSTYDLAELNIANSNFQQRSQFSFAKGFTLTNGLETVVYEGVEYRWGGAFPKTAAAGSTPSESGWVRREGFIPSRFPYNTPGSTMAEKLQNAIQNETVINSGNYDAGTDPLIITNEFVRNSGVINYSGATEAFSMVGEGVMEGGTIKAASPVPCVVVRGGGGGHISNITVEGDISSSGTAAYALRIIGVDNYSCENIKGGGHTGLIYISDSNNITVSRARTEKTIYHTTLDAGGYGVLLTGSKNIILDSLYFVTGDGGDASGYNGRHAVYVSTNGTENGFCENIDILNLYADYTLKPTNPLGAVNIRNGKNVKIDGATLIGVGITGVRDTGSCYDISVMNSNINQVVRSGSTSYGISLGNEVGSYKPYNTKVCNNTIKMKSKDSSVVINNSAWGVMVNGEGFTVTGNTFDTEANIYPILVKAGAKNVVISNNTDVTTGGQAFILFEGACSNVKVIGNILSGRTYFRNITNCTDLTVDFPRSFVMAWTGTVASVAVTGDEYSTYKGCSLDGSTIVVEMNSHVTLDAIKGVTATFVGKESMPHPSRITITPVASSKSVTIRCYDAAGAVIAPGGYSFAVRVAV